MHFKLAFMFALLFTPLNALAIPTNHVLSKRVKIPSTPEFERGVQEGIELATKHLKNTKNTAIEKDLSKDNHHKFENFKLVNKNAKSYKVNNAIAGTAAAAVVLTGAGVGFYELFNPIAEANKNKHVVVNAGLS